MSDQDQALWRLLYCSQACIEGFTMMTEMSAILAVSARNNLRDRITGLLVYDDGLFVQVLEGRRSAVHACYDRITRDERHCEPRILVDERADQRLFPRWRLGFVDAIETEDYAALSEKLKAGTKEALDAMICIGRETGLVQQVTA